MPDEICRDVKRLAADKEWSLAETLRRGAELLLERYPQVPERAEIWQLPEPRDLGWRGMTHQEVHEAAIEDMEATA